ncbi:hypothetical protein TcBrA4_0077560 [Trypanosoma cruzi]|nr:hypothetical protein TcBrA4_0077560 [Trypanosoma cruzi]
MWSIPVVHHHKDDQREAFNATLESVVDEQFPDASVVEAMGAEVGLDAALCSAPATRMVCCQRLQKLAVMYAAMGATDSAPTVMANKAKLDAVAARTSTSRRATTPAYPRMWRAAALDCRLRESCFATCARRCFLRVTPTGNTKIMMQYAHRVPIQTALARSERRDATGETFLVDLLAR